jgi:hypothetical protein
MTTTSKKWTEELVAELNSIVGNESPVTGATVAKAAEALEVSERSIAAKLRNLGLEVESTAKSATSTFTAEETEALEAFVVSNSGSFTYKELAGAFADGKFSAKQVQGKVLSLELTEHVKAAEKVEAVRQYSDAEEATFVKMALAGAYLEEIAEALNKELNSARGKALSLLRAGLIEKTPAQKVSTAKESVDQFAALGDAIATMTVKQVADAIDKTERGVRTIATRRGIDLADYKGSDKRAKADAKTA